MAEEVVSEQTLKGTTDGESLKKIQQSRGSGSDIVTLVRRVFPDLEKQLGEESVDLEERVRRIKEFADSKTNDEILQQARNVYDGLMTEVKDQPAYDLARAYLDTERVKFAGQKLFDNRLQAMRESKDKKERMEAATRILSKRFAPEISRSSALVEEALETLLESRDKRRRLTEEEFYINELRYSEALDWLEEPIRNKAIINAVSFLKQK